MPGVPDARVNKQPAKGIALRKILAALAALVPVSALAAFAVAAAPAAQASPRFTCGSPAFCAFVNNNWTGDYTEWFTTPGGQNDDQWLSLQTTKGSVNDNSNSPVEVWNAQNQSNECLFGHNRYVLNNQFGYFYIAYGAQNCSNVPFYN